MTDNLSAEAGDHLADAGKMMVAVRAALPILDDDLQSYQGDTPPRLMDARGFVCLEDLSCDHDRWVECEATLKALAAIREVLPADEWENGTYTTSQAAVEHFRPRTAAPIAKAEESSDQALARDYAELRDTYDRVVVERDEWKERAGFLWTAPDVDMWGKVAESKGVHIREKVNGLLRRAVRAEGQNEALAQVLLDVRAAIVEHAPDTLWVSLIETAVDCIDAVLAATAPAEARAAYPAWRRIEALPDEMRDGREVILRRGDRVGGACWCTWPDTEIAEGGEGWSVGCDGSSWDDEKSPTHWMPLPDPAEACPLTNPRGSK